MKRLFLFAGYDPQGMIGKSLLHYVSSLSEYGDVIVVMDNDCVPEEMRKLCGIVIHSEEQRHGEYDFGSYKRAFYWAEANLSLAEYDFCYLVNDSVFGPLRDLVEYFARMESGGGMSDAFSFVMNPHRSSPHLQSWFIGLRKNVFLSGWFRDFLEGISRQESKEMVCNLYETGLSSLLRLHGCRMSALYEVKGKRIYNNVRSLYEKGLPFIKKSAFTRHRGALGTQVKYVLDHIDGDVRKAILSDAERVWGRDYVRNFLTDSRYAVLLRYLRYMADKLTS